MVEVYNLWQENSLASAEAFGARPDIAGHSRWTALVEVGEHWYAIGPGDDVTSLVACMSQGTILRPRIHDVSFIASAERRLVV